MTDTYAVLDADDLRRIRARITPSVSEPEAVRDESWRQPVHVLYGGAHRFSARTPARLAELALDALDTYAPDTAALADALEWDGSTRARAAQLHARIRARIEREPVEDLRIDFEDGYGYRPDAEEDADAVRAALQLAEAMHAGSIPRCVGVRIKPLDTQLHERALRTLDRFVSTLVRKTGGVLPSGFVVTLPKITHPAQVAACVDALAALERAHGLSSRALSLELMIETPEAVLARDGRCALPSLIDAGDGRVTSLHLGAYDYLSLIGVGAGAQRLDHPACDAVRRMMQVSARARGVHVCDGATNTLPIGPHRGSALTAGQHAENRDVVWHAWRVAYRNNLHALKSGYVQGWDLHPAQLVARYAALFSFVLDGLDEEAARLRNFIDQAATATRVGAAFDDAATAQGLLNSFLLAHASGAIADADVEATGITVAELRGRSFLRIIEARRQ